jgi:CDP-diacylglycerol---serine O-phosphatidyltransferase
MGREDVTTLMRHIKTGRKRPLRRPHLALHFNLRKAMFVLPNLFTISSIFCGFYAILLSSGEPGPQQFYRASLAVFFGIFFDMADGRVARLTRTQSDFGMQLDSLADAVTFGVAPAVIVHKWGLAQLGFLGVLAAFAYLTCGVLRLARFNVLASHSPGVKKYFTGLPIPLAAGVIVSLVMFHQTTYRDSVTREAHILVLVLVLSYLMISNIRYRSFKDVRPGVKSVTALLALIALFTLIATQIEPTFAILAFFSAYVSVGLIEEVVQFARHHDARPSPAAPLRPDPTGPAAQGGQCVDKPREVPR